MWTFAIKQYVAALVFLLTFQRESPPPPAGAADRIKDIRTRLLAVSSQGVEQRELEKFVLHYLDDAQKALNVHHPFQADRFADAADACRRPIEHLQHIAIGRRGARAPDDDVRDHLRQVYFRLRLCDVFLEEIPPPPPKRLLELSRTYYDRATQAEQEGNRTNADEYAKAADDLTHALESLAQAYVPEGAK
jgi:hypothetical protein